MGAFPRAIAAVAAATLVAAACASDPEPRERPEDAPDAWRLTAATDAPPGSDLYEPCASCHLADGGGRPDGTIPRLAGQPAAILEQKLAGLRDGSIYLPVMVPFARALTDEEIGPLAAFVASLPAPERIGTGTTDDTEPGRRRYAELCAGCHGATGAGDATLRAPRLCGQHAPYLARRLAEMTVDAPRAVDPAMRALAAALTPDERAAISAHLARLDCTSASEGARP